MSTRRDVGDAVLDAGGEYLLFVKNNQETLHADIAATFDGVESFSPIPAAAMA